MTSEVKEHCLVPLQPGMDRTAVFHIAAIIPACEVQRNENPEGFAFGIF
jgi:hypothetical protein